METATAVVTSTSTSSSTSTTIASIEEIRSDTNSRISLPFEDTCTGKAIAASSATIHCTPSGASTPPRIRSGMIRVAAIPTPTPTPRATPIQSTSTSARRQRRRRALYSSSSTCSSSSTSFSSPSPISPRILASSYPSPSSSPKRNRGKHRPSTARAPAGSTEEKQLREENGGNNSVMFNIKILILCILITHINESMLCPTTPSTPMQHSTYMSPTIQQSNGFDWKDYPVLSHAVMSSTNPMSSTDHEEMESSMTHSRSEISSQSQPQHLLHPTTELHNDTTTTTNPPSSQLSHNKPLKHHSIFWPYTFLNSSLSPPPQSYPSLLSLQNQFQSFYTNSIHETLPQQQQQQSHNKHHHHHQQLHSAQSQRLQYDITKSTEDNYKLMSSPLHPQNQTLFYGKYKHIRSTLDYEYHSNYILSRQLVQDEIIQYILSKNPCCHTTTADDMVDSDANAETKTETTLTSDPNPNSNQSTKSPWIMFTAGAMGAGKSYTIKYLHSKNRFPLNDFIIIDPDEIRHLLPEYQYYIQQTNNTSMNKYAGIYTKKESGYICEILVQIALRRGCNVLVDGSLKDYKWYKEHFQSLRDQFHNQKCGIRIGILHIQAPKDAILERARMRSKITKRVVPTHVLEESIEMVPKSVKILSQYVDFFVELYNGPNASDIEIRTEGVTWDTFREVFYRGSHWMDERMVPSTSSDGMVGNVSDDNREKLSTTTTTTEEKLQLTTSTNEVKVSAWLHPTRETDDWDMGDDDDKSNNSQGSKKTLPLISINPGLKVDKELDYQLLRLLSKL